MIEGVTIRAVARHADARGWLAELYRSDEAPAGQLPVMGYVSFTHPGVVRGPHEHREQTDWFAFLGPGMFRIWLWDARRGSATEGRMQRLEAGAERQLLVVVPPGVVHAYKNIAGQDGMVLNFPNRLYAGEGRREEVDEIRHEDAADSPFVLA